MERICTNYITPPLQQNLFTAATALAKLGADYRFETTVYIDADISEGIANNIYLKGKADPVLQRNDIVKLGDALLQTGIQSVRGKIIIDDTYLDRVPEGPGWMRDDRPLIISALSIREIEPRYEHMEPSLCVWTSSENRAYGERYSCARRGGLWSRTLRCKSYR